MDYQSRISKRVKDKLKEEDVHEQEIDDLVYSFEQKKSIHIKNYRHYLSTNDIDTLVLAAIACKKYKVSPAAFVQTVYDRLGKHKGDIRISHLSAKSVEKHFGGREEAVDELKIEITNSTLAYADIWQYQHELAMRYINNGETVESVLMDSSLKFFAWYRILSTPRPNYEIIHKYKHIAKEEWNSRLEKFAKSQGLDIGRILY